MNNFEPVSIKKASRYLQERLEIFQKEKDTEKETGTVYVVKPKKDSMIKRLVGSIFHT